MRLCWVTDTPALDWRIQVANPFNPENAAKTPLERRESAAGQANGLQSQDLTKRAA
jgi:hypothetical protein